MRDKILFMIDSVFPMLLRLMTYQTTFSWDIINRSVLIKEDEHFFLYSEVSFDSS